MNNIEALMQVDFRALIITIFIVVFGIIAIVEAAGKISEYIGKPLGWFRKRQADHDLIVDTANKLTELKKQHDEAVCQSVRDDEIIKKDLSQIATSVQNLSIKLDVMQNKIDEAEVANIRTTLINYYNKFKNADNWTPLEKDAFNRLLKEYENRGGDGYIHSVVLPVMEELKVVDK